MATFTLRALLGAVCVAAMAPASLGAAQERSDPGALPVRLVERPLTLPGGTLRADLAFETARFDGPRSEGRDMTTLWTGASLGIADDFELSFVPVVLQVDPDVDYIGLGIGATLRLVEATGAELGVRVWADVNDTLDRGEVTFSMPVLIRAGDVLRIDTGVALAVGVLGGDDIDTSVRLADSGWTRFPVSGAAIHAPEPGIPFVLNLNVIDNFFFGARSGLGILELDDAGDTVFVPLGFQAGVSLTAGDLLIDVSGGLRFPLLYVSGRGEASTDLWLATLEASFFFPLS